MGSHHIHLVKAEHFSYSSCLGLATIYWGPRVRVVLCSFLSHLTPSQISPSVSFGPLSTSLTVRDTSYTHPTFVSGLRRYLAANPRVRSKVTTAAAPVELARY